MKLTKKLLPLTGAAALALSAFATPMAAQAEMSAGMAFSNMYLWRGQNLTPNGAAISGSLDYSHESGMYAGIWASTENGGHETDLYVGFSGSAGEISYDVSYFWYLYPEDGQTGAPDPSQDLGDTDLSELIGSIGFGPATFTLYIGVDTERFGAPDDDYFYYTFAFDINDQFNILFGGWSWDETDGADYTHLTLTYSPLDELSFAVSMAQEDATDSLEEDPLFQVTYSKSFDLKAK